MDATNKTRFLFSLIQFLNTGFFAFILVFFPIYAEYLSFNAKEIGTFNIFSVLATMLASPLILYFVNQTFQPSLLLKICSLLSPITYLGLLMDSSFLWFSFFWTSFVGLRIATNTLVDVQLLKLSARGTLRFELVRVWGSIGFILLGTGFGILFDFLDTSIAVWIILFFVVFQSVVSFKLSYLLEPFDLTSKSLTFKDILKLFLTKRILGLFLSIGFIWLSHAPFYVYLSLYLQAIGWNSSQISLAWNMGVLAEIVLFLCFRRIEIKSSLTSILTISMIITVARWLIIGFSDNFYLILFSQTLHAFSFGACYLVSMRLSYEWFPEGYKEKSQGLLTLFSVGLGSLAGRLLVTFLAKFHEGYADFSSMFYVAACIASIGVLLSRLCIEKTSDSG
jgi:MFS transporter, PPP family, 3-phenylpropionic acid transporter